MERSVSGFGILSGNVLKILAAISMLADHVGLLFFPHVIAFRIVGRIAMPIFAFMIAEGCRYTRNKLRYFLSVFLLALLCQTAYYLYDGDTYMSILVTFSLSILMLFAMQSFKRALLRKDGLWRKIGAGALFVVSVVAAWLLNQALEIDYGFFGCMLPVFAGLPASPDPKTPSAFDKWDRLPVRVTCLAIGMLLLALAQSGIQAWSFLALPLLFLYSGKRGKRKMKYFFYIFYPVHLLVLQGIALLL